MSDLTLASRFVAAARQRVGTPWEDLDDKLPGLACAVLVIDSARDAGLPVEYPKLKSRVDRPQPRLLHAYLPRWTRAVSLDDRLPGDVVMMRYPGVDGPVHMGVLADKPGRRPESIIHVPRKAPCVEIDFDPRDFPVRGVYRPRSNHG